MTTGEGPTLYEAVGGRPAFHALVDAFYRRVEEEPLLRALYPEDLSGPRARLAAFLVQYFGGPPDYALLRGEPRLRLRHVEFSIDTPARDAWVAAMADAVAEVGFAPEVAGELMGYFAATATFLVNRGGLAITGG
ncbi:MAG TPA: globin [Acidimicrobiales bacterium]|nr:globin [Acidimicrobiales bacterium]